MALNVTLASLFLRMIANAECVVYERRRCVLSNTSPTAIEMSAARNQILKIYVSTNNRINELQTRSSRPHERARL